VYSLKYMLNKMFLYTKYKLRDNFDMLLMINNIHHCIEYTKLSLYKFDNLKNIESNMKIHLNNNLTSMQYINLKNYMLNTQLCILYKH
jgi:hypothetical protein